MFRKHLNILCMFYVYCTITGNTVNKFKNVLDSTVSPCTTLVLITIVQVTLMKQGTDKHYDYPYMWH